MKRTGPSFAALATLCALTACGGGSKSATAGAAAPSSAAAPASTAPAPSAFPSPTPTPLPPVTASAAPRLLTKAEAGAAYLRNVKTLNVVIFATSPILDNRTRPFSERRAAAGRLADALHAWDTFLVTSVWPANVQPHIDRFLEATTAEQSVMRQMSRATTAAEFYDTEARHNFDLAPEQAALIRQLLGLAETPAG